MGLVNSNYYGTPPSVRNGMEQVLQQCLQILYEDVFNLHELAFADGGESEGKNGHVTASIVKGTWRRMEVEWHRITMWQYDPGYFAVLEFADCNGIKLFRGYCTPHINECPEVDWENVHAESGTTPFPYYFFLQKLASGEWHDTKGWHEYSFRHPMPYLVKDYIYGLEHPV